MRVLGTIGFAAAVVALSSTASAQYPPGEGPALGSNRTTQADITGGGLTLTELRAAGLKMFSTPFNLYDGYGDGPMNPNDTTSPGGRPTLQDNGTFLRVNGLDAQTCMECHSVGSNLTAPFTFAIGGVGGSNNNAIFQPREIDVSDSQLNGFAFFNGRYINPPFLFGSGGVELAGKEMTQELQAIKEQAKQDPDVDYDLKAKKVRFGKIRFDSQTQTFDTSGVQGVDHDLVVRPFGRKGEFATVRGFDVGAMEFHFGMQPVEVVGPDVDADGDGVANEILAGELSALHIFNTNLERPEIRELSPEAIEGGQVFRSLGCVRCHTPTLNTDSRNLTYAFPEVDTDPNENAFLSVDLHTSPAGFELNDNGGLRVPLFSDLKRHNMGPHMAESFGNELDEWFITARLWGVADTAPYMHDGRATTLTQAIGMHGGEAQPVADAFDALTDNEKINLLTFLRSLRTPLDPASDL